MSVSAVVASRKTSTSSCTRSAMDDAWTTKIASTLGLNSWIDGWISRGGGGGGLPPQCVGYFC